ncbi:glycophorin-C isoform X3 [Ovis canadensis]|uniref:glycophorin-C isoform X3 n=1 Tax=Ovis canadensis TaxID=37174 RepID=UPI003753A4C2
MSTLLPLTTTQQGTEKAAVMETPLWTPGVIAAMAFVLVGLLLLMLHYMYRHKGTYHTNEAKGTEFAESADVALQDDPSLQDNGGSSKKEYFI